MREENPAKLEHLKQLYNLDSQSPIRLVPKWSDDQEAKKISYQFYQLAVEALDTSLFVETVNYMWDLLNSNTIEDPLSKTPINKKDFDFQEQSFEKF